MKEQPDEDFHVSTVSSKEVAAFSTHRKLIALAIVEASPET